MLFAGVALPALLAILLVYGNRYQRAFSIGALFPTVAALLCLTVMIGMRLFEAFDFARELPLDLQEISVIVAMRCRAFLGACWLAEIALGVICFLVSSLLISRQVETGESEREELYTL